MRKLFRYDSLTELPKGRWFINSLEKYFKNLDKDNAKGAIFYVDVDNFQVINNIYGYAFGDEVMKQIALRLKKCGMGHRRVCEGIIARIVSDEFVVFYPGIDSKEAAGKLAYSILEEFDNSIICDGNKLYVSLSIGIVLYPDHGFEVDSLLRHASMAVHSVKEDGKNSFGIYESSMSKKAIDAVNIKADLKEAIKYNQFKVHYHPQIDLVSNEIVSLEALTRWNHPERGLIYPNDFISLAEETGFIIPMGDFVLKSACKQLKTWHDSGFPKYSISVNISPIQLQQRRFVEKLENTLEDTGLDPSYLEIEITEHNLIKYMGPTKDVLDRLRSMGIKISLDDFGTGYSSLNYLKNLPVDIIKMDKTFIDNIEEKAESMITNAIIELGHDMDLCIVAEGIETKKQLQILKEQGCDRAQGFLFTKPLSNTQMEKKMEKMDQQNRAL